jgi:hypothetical protein
MGTFLITSLETKLEIKNRMKRNDSIGLPESPNQILLMNLFNKSMKDN